MNFEFTEQQLELLRETFGYYVEDGVGNRIEIVNDYWKVVEGIGIMMGIGLPSDASVVLDDRYSLGTKSLTEKIKEKEALN